MKPSTAERMLLRANLLAKRKLERVKLEMIATLQSEAGKALFEQQVSMAATAMAFEKSEVRLCRRVFSLRGWRKAAKC